MNLGDVALTTGSEDRTVKTWYMSDMSMISSVDDCITSGIKIMTLSPNNTFLVVGQYSNCCWLLSYTVIIGLSVDILRRVFDILTEPFTV